jgi:hypothetical protein
VPVTRKGKIAQLPFALRELLNQRLRDGQLAPKILPWLNGAAGLRGRGCINDGNISEWRQGGYQDWLAGQEQVEKTRRLAEHCLRIAEAGGSAMALPASIAGAQLMEVLEGLDPETLKAAVGDDPENWLKTLEILARLQRSKADERMADQGEKKLEQNARKLSLAEQTLQLKTCELFLEWYANKRAAEIAENQALKPDVKIAQLRELMFGAPKDPDA